MILAGLHVDPVVGLVDSLSNWAWHQAARLAGTWMSAVVFRPLTWQGPVGQLYALSRDLAWTGVGLIIVGVALRSLWPQFTWMGNRGFESIPFFLERLVAAGLMGLAGVWVVRGALAVNNGVVGALMSSAVGWNPQAVPGGVLSPLVVLVVSVAMLVLLLYLAVFYAVRAIELFILTAAIPWFALWWATRTDDAVLSALAREFAVVIFVQSFQAGAFWLAIRVMSQGHWGFMGIFLELALLWYMTKLPGQLRRLVGTGPGVTPLWR